MRYYSFVFLLFALPCFSQTEEILTIDLMKIKEGNEKEAQYFFENNWKLLRDTALARGYIVGYEMLNSTSDTSRANILLVTRYADTDMFQKAEENFQSLIRQLRPNGPVYLNSKKRQELFNFVESYTTRRFFGS